MDQKVFLVRSVGKFNKLFLIFFGKLLQYGNEQKYKSADNGKIFERYLFDSFECAEGKEDKEETEHKAVAVIEPLRLLESVPHEVNG